ncbi:alpha/beta hydrolase [Actinopolymorpha sp. NPDC004070]|uniref:alpha/beta fold hydrolase n=1 Tax=Actinopolymorpha sp. NPDC004070 TaxID=3154548 RepID=UPI0033B84740
MQEAAGVFERAGSALRYRMAGPGDGPVVVLGAGRWLDHRMWGPQLPVLWEAGYRTLTWELPTLPRDRRTFWRELLARKGSAPSPDAVPDVSVPVESVPVDHVRTYATPVVRENLTVRGLAEALLELADRLRAHRQLALVGHSFGGQVAQEAAFLRPERVAGLVVVAAGCLTLPRRPWTVPAHRWGRLAALAFATRRDARIRHEAARAAGVDAATQTHAYLAMEHIDKTRLTQVWRAGETSAHPEPQYRIDQPLLLVRGEFDRTSRLGRHAKRWLDRDPRAEYEVVDRAGYLANLDNPRAFNRVLLDFLTARHPVPRNHRRGHRAG